MGSSQLSSGKGSGKGAPPPPASRSVPKPAAAQPPLRLKVRDSDSDGLAPVPYTVVTGVDGSRTLVGRDGSSKQLPADWCGEDGLWGIRDEGAIMGVAMPPTDADGEQQEEEELLVDEGLSPRSGLRALAKRRPALAEYVESYEDGVPLKVLRCRIVGALGPKLADAFLRAAEGAPLGPSAPSVLPVDLEGSASERHGRLGDPSWAAPRLAARCAELARPGYNTAAAHEYLDTPEVLDAKVALLAQLIRKSKRLVIYAGAGLSTGSGIGDYATRTGGAGVLGQRSRASSQSSHISPFCAKPNVGHRTVAALAEKGLVWRFVQQNHDGLPQKAGVPQHLMNEIHGSWFDPSNGVVPMSGSLRGDLFEDLLHCERCADMVLVLGSSLCGMNADRLVSSCANRAKRSVPSDPTLGSVIVSLQRTPHDANSSLRLFATIDDVMELLATKLSLTPPPEGFCVAPQAPEEHMPLGLDVDVFSVPHDARGRLQAGQRSPPSRLQLDLREGAELVVAFGREAGALAEVVGKNADGHFRISVQRSFNKSADAPADAPAKTWQEVRLLGNWWPAALVAGEVPYLPVVPRSSWPGLDAQEADR